MLTDRQNDSLRLARIPLHLDAHLQPLHRILHIRAAALLLVPRWQLHTAKCRQTPARHPAYEQRLCVRLHGPRRMSRAQLGVSFRAGAKAAAAAAAIAAAVTVAAAVAVANTVTGRAAIAAVAVTVSGSAGSDAVPLPRAAAAAAASVNSHWQTFTRHPAHELWLAHSGRGDTHYTHDCRRARSRVHANHADRLHAAQREFRQIRLESRVRKRAGEPVQNRQCLRLTGDPEFALCLNAAAAGEEVTHTLTQRSRPGGRRQRRVRAALFLYTRLARACVRVRQQSVEKLCVTVHHRCFVRHLAPSVHLLPSVHIRFRGAPCAISSERDTQCVCGGREHACADTGGQPI
mmetsp:Transcript_18740/g.43729  ORF Transcript_18740/g.43729 Transcript_18740/m.43729 type:complete len:347 (+) Transcript_18740:1008-2048(+)